MVNSTGVGLGGLLAIIVIAAIAVTIWYLTLPDKKEDKVKEDSSDESGDDSSLPPACPVGKLSADGKTCTMTCKTDGDGICKEIDEGDGGTSSSDSSTPPETKDPGQQNGSDDATLTSGPCVYGGTSEGKFGDGIHCRLGKKKDSDCPKGVPKKCWNYGNNKYYTMPLDTKAVPGKCPLGGSFDQVNCYLGPASAACPPGVKKCFVWKGSKYYEPIDPA